MPKRDLGRARTYAFQMRAHSLILAIGCASLALIDAGRLLLCAPRDQGGYYAIAIACLVASSCAFACLYIMKSFRAFRLRSLLLILASLLANAFSKDLNPSWLMLCVLGVFDGIATGLFSRRTAPKALLLWAAICLSNIYKWSWVNSRRWGSAAILNLGTPLFIAFYLPQLYPRFIAPVRRLIRLGLDLEELDLSRFLASSSSYKEIAAMTGMREPALRKTAAQVFAKTGVRSREALCAFLVEGPPDEGGGSARPRSWLFSGKAQNALLAIFWAMTLGLNLYELSIGFAVRDSGMNLVGAMICLILSVIGYRSRRINPLFFCGASILFCGLFYQAYTFPVQPHTAMLVAFGLFAIGLAQQLSPKAYLGAGIACFIAVLPLSLLSCALAIRGPIPLDALLDILASALLGLYFWLVLYYYDSFVFPIYARGDRKAVEPAPAVFTEREREMADLAERGMSYKEIAAQVGLSAATVRVYFTRMFRKLDVNKRLDFIRAWQAWKEAAEASTRPTA